jgi:pyroglutamyl-peptidase
MKTILLTGFEPWQEFKTNPSQQIVERLDGETIGGAVIAGLTLPVVFGEDTKRVFAAITDLKPILVLSLGLHAGRPCLDVERFAVNRRVSDAGEREQAIVEDGPADYYATIDVENVTQAIARAGVPVQAHEYAGNFLCNHILYQILHSAAVNNLNYRAGFIHLPQSSEAAAEAGQTRLPTLPLETMAQGVCSAINEAV